MQIKDIKLLLNATLLCSEDTLDFPVRGAFASDLMSDVLAIVKDQNILLTGLCNPQVIRTAEMLDMNCIILVRGKTPTPDFIEMAGSRNICLLATDKTMFVTCGILYSNGVNGGSNHG